MIDTATVRGMPTPARSAVPEESARRLIFYVFAAIIYLAMFGIRVLPDFSVSFSLVAV